MHHEPTRPTAETPMLIGLVIDVSGSMMTSIENRSGKNLNRLESFRDALDGLVERAGKLSRSDSGEAVAPLLKLFAYAFGFGNLLASLFGGSGDKVRDILRLPGARSSTVPLDVLTRDWQQYRRHVEGMAREMFGNTPMREGLAAAGERLSREIKTSSYFGQPIIFLLSDGDPTDATPQEVAAVASQIKSAGALIVSCYVTSDDIAEPRHLYSRAPSFWPNGAALMLECASEVPPESPFSAYLRERQWRVEAGGRLFTQVNQSEVLSEFMNLVLSPLESNPAPATPRRTNVFVSYSHVDKDYVSTSGLLGYLSGLSREGVDFWHDERLVAGENWDERILDQINASDVALVLVSQAFLNSAYCQDVEIASFLSRRASAGLVVFPIIIAPCDWKSHAWLSATQFEPRGGKSIEADYKDRGSREALYLQILQQLRTVIQAIQFRRQTGV